MGNNKYTGNELMKAVNIKHRPSFLYNYLQPAIKAGYIGMTIPDKPNSSKQKYYLTERGKEELAQVIKNRSRNH